MKYDTTVRVLVTCLLLQIAQDLIPSFIYVQALQGWELQHLITLPLFLIGMVLHMFSHGGWDHLLGNMSFGVPILMFVESRIGSRDSMKLYLACGVAAACTQLCIPAPSAGLIGASGALFGCLGAACMLLMQASVTEAAIGAFMLTIWLLPQLVALASSGFMPIAFGAHVGGCVAGVALMGMSERKRDNKPHRRPNKTPK